MQKNKLDPRLEDLHNALRAVARSRAEIQIADDVWITASGKRIPISQLKKDHMQHIIRQYMRNAVLKDHLNAYHGVKPSTRNKPAAVTILQHINIFHKEESERIRNEEASA